MTAEAIVKVDEFHVNWETNQGDCQYVGLHYRINSGTITYSRENWVGTVESRVRYWVYLISDAY